MSRLIDQRSPYKEFELKITRKCKDCKVIERYETAPSCTVELRLLRTTACQKYSFALLYLEYILEDSLQF